MRKGRKGVTKLIMKGVAADGVFVFEARTFEHIEYRTNVKLTEYEKGTARLAFDSSESMHRVTEIVAGCFGEKSNFKADKIEIEYRNVYVAVTRAEGRKNIINMLMKELKTSTDVKDVPVDMETCKKDRMLKIEQNEVCEFFMTPIRTFYFDRISSYGKDLWFRNYGRECIIISSIKDGIVKAEAVAGEYINDFLVTVSRCFNPYNNMYGIKGVEIKFNEFSMLVSEWNVNSIKQMYERCCDMSSNLWEKEWEEYIHSPEYIKKRAKALKKEFRHKAVVEKIRKFHQDMEFEVKATAVQDWQECKRVNSKENYDRAIIRYIILWVQYMEYLNQKYGMKISDIWDNCSNLADIEGVTGFMYGAAASIISRVWQHGEEFRKCYNAKWNYYGDETVNPAVLTLSA